MIEKLFNRTKILEKSLDASWMRNETISQNIANVDTPGYKRKTVNFEDFLSSAMENSDFKRFRTDPRHYPKGNSDAGSFEISVSQDNSALSTRLDGNNVDIEREMAEMAKNTIKYNTVTQSLAGKFKSIKSVITSR